jgi:hypothetical protein
MSREKSLIGQSSMRMQLGPDSEEAELVRLTYTIDAENLRGKDWYALCQLMVLKLVDAEASMRVFLNNDEGERIRRYEVTLPKPTKIFEPLVIDGDSLAPQAATISLQLALKALKEEGSGTIFWDGAVLISGKDSPGEHCAEITNTQCSWEKTVNLAQGRINSGIQAIQFKLADASELVLAGPFYENDRLSFRDNMVYLERDGRLEVPLANFPVALEDSLLDLAVMASVPPILRVFPGS